MNAFSHEQPFLLVLPPEEPVEAAVPRALSEPGIRHLAFPAPWALDKAGIDLPAAAPDLRSITLETIGPAIRALLRLCGPEALDALVRRAWAEADERVRQHYLELSIGQTFGQIFKVRPASGALPPPPAFRRDRIHENGLEIQYRLAPGGEAGTRTAPPEEGSLVLYPFDPANEEARSESALGPGSGAVLEIFAYESGRAQHLAFWEGLAARQGWHVVDPREREGG